MNTLQFTITGMHCDACAKVCAMDLQNIPGVVKAFVDYQTKKAMIESPDNVSIEEIRHVIEHDGYGIQFNENDQKPL